MPKKRRRGIRHRPSRVVLSEMLPYELPVIFNNFGLYQFLNDTKYRFDGKVAHFVSRDPGTATVLRVIFGKDAEIRSSTSNGEITYEIGIKAISRATIPFQYTIRHRESQTRQLSVPHPLSQLEMVNVYDRFKGLLLYHTNGSDFSVRHPARVTRYTIIRDSVFEERKSASHGRVELANREYDQLRSYFVYKRYDNVNKFYESIEYRESEKRFGHLLRLDISKCFDSIYTHSLGWAVSDKESVKRERRQHETTFADAFDVAIRHMNDNETHGILIGPEVSRIFAEVVLQRVDRDVEGSLRRKGLLHGQDYEVLRYVDDYFIFMTTPTLRDTVVGELEAKLRPFKLALNAQKEDQYTTPFMSDMSIAKERTVRDLSRQLSMDVEEADPEAELVEIAFGSSSKEMLTAYKTTLRATNLNPLELVNYTLSTLERRAELLVEQYVRWRERTARISAPEERRRVQLENERQLAKALLAIVDFAFYVYGGSPRVGPAIKLARLVTLCRLCASETQFSADTRGGLDDKVYLELRTQLNRNPLGQSSAIEGLYLLTLLGDLGPHYRLDLASLCRFAGVDDSRPQYEIPEWYNAFTMTNVLKYVGNHSGYSPVRDALESWTLERVKRYATFGRPVAEQAMLVLDALASPYVSVAAKSALLSHYGVASKSVVAAAIGTQDRWFTNWADFDLYAELKNKRVQEVY